MAYWHAEARLLATYVARRSKLGERVEGAENELLRLREADVTDWSSDEVAANCHASVLTVGTTNL
jgi:hypothetical protein